MGLETMEQNEAVETCLKTTYKDSPNTASTYGKAWRHWTGWLLGHRVKEARPRHAMNYLAEWSKGKAPNTVHNRIAALKSLYGHLLQMELADVNPFATPTALYSKRQKTQKRPTATLDSFSVKRILELGFPSSPTGIRDRALLYLLFGGGLRRSEARALNVGDVKIEGKRLYVELGKTKKGQADKQPLPEWAAIVFMDLVSQRKLEGAEGNDPIFVDYWRKLYNEHPPRMADSTVYRIFKRNLARLNILAAPHAARAAGATQLLNQKKSAWEVARWLRHSDEQTVKTYDHRRLRVQENAGNDLDYKKVVG